jgi:serine/threonine-protein phosphatase 5
MTENRGAYINIGPDYKLKFSQFDAVPHPNIRPMVSPQCQPCVLFRAQTANSSQAYAQNSVMSSLM